MSEPISPSPDDIVGVNAVDGDGEEDDDEAENEDVSERMREVRRLQGPKLPSAAEVEAHRMTHLPFRLWCKRCVAGRGREDAHQKQKEADVG